MAVNPKIGMLLIFSIGLLITGVVHGEITVSSQVNAVSMTSNDGGEVGQYGDTNGNQGDGISSDSATDTDSSNEPNTNSDTSNSNSGNRGSSDSGLDNGDDYEINSDTNTNNNTNTVRNKVVSINRVNTRNIQPVLTPILVKEKISEKLKEKIFKHVQLKNDDIANNMVKVREQINVKIQNAEENSTEAKNSYAVAKQKYIESKNTGLALGHAKTMMQSGSKFVLSWLDRIELKVLETEGMDDETKVSIIDRINEYREGIQELEEKMNNTSDLSELRAISKEVNEYWKEIKLFITSVAYQISAAKLNVIISNADEVELRIHDKIAELNEAGEDTSALEELLSNYQENMELAEEKIDEANDVLSTADTIEEINEGRRLILEATRYIKDAFKDIRDLIKEYNRYKVQSGMVFIGNQTGELYAEGDGHIEVKCTGIVVAKGNRTVEVTPYTAIISSWGNGEKTMNGSTTTLEGRGAITVRGEDIKIILEGYDLQVFAKGTGSAYLDGEGMYKVKKLPGDNMTEIYYDGALNIEFGGE